MSTFPFPFIVPDYMKPWTAHIKLSIAVLRLLPAKVVVKN